MKKSKLTLNELIHDGAMYCFDWIGYLTEDPPDFSFGFDESLWKKSGEYEKFKELQKYHIDAVEYISKYKIKEDEFEFEFQEQYLNNKHYLALSIFGNKVEYFLFSHMTPKQIESRFADDESYYTLNDLKEAIEFAKNKLQ